MSKPSSGHFSGTTGANILRRENNNISLNREITTAYEGMDFREHPVKNYSATSINKIRTKVASRTANKDEYRKLQQHRRLANRRKAGVREFWRQERERLNHNQKGTRNWNPTQIREIKAGKTPKLDKQPIQGHHTYSVKRFPHLANKGVLIYPVTFHEHLYECHGGNFKNDLPSNTYKHMKKDF